MSAIPEDLRLPPGIPKEFRDELKMIQSDIVRARRRLKFAEDGVANSSTLVDQAILAYQEGASSIEDLNAIVRQMADHTNNANYYRNEIGHREQQLWSRIEQIRKEN